MEKTSIKDKKIKELEEEIQKHKECLKNKDKRIEIIEKRWENIIGGFWFIIGCVCVFFSYYFIYLVMTKIGENLPILLKWVNDKENYLYGGYYYQQDVALTLSFYGITIFLFIILTIGWLVLIDWIITEE